MDLLWIQLELEYDQALSKNWINVLNIQELTKSQVTKPNSHRNPYLRQMNRLKQARKQMNPLKQARKQMNRTKTS